MTISSRYKIIGKRKHAILDLPYEEVLDTFEEALCDPDNGKLTGSVNRDTGVFKIEYRVAEGKNEVYENYCMLVELSETDDGGTKIEYALVFDRLISLYTNFLSLVCFIVPLVASLLVYFKFELRSPVHLALYIPLLLISSFGIFSLFGYREHKENVKPMVKIFEKMLVALFDE